MSRYHILLKKKVNFLSRIFQKRIPKENEFKTEKTQSISL